MSSKIIYSVTVVPIQDTTLEGKTFEAVESDVGKALSAQNNSFVWAGNSITGWSAGVPTYKSSDGDTIVSGGADDGIWVKHTGFDYADGTTINTATVILTVNTKVIAQLESGEAIFLPNPGAYTITLSDDGTPVQVEYGIFT